MNLLNFYTAIIKIYLALRREYMDKHRTSISYEKTQVVSKTFYCILNVSVPNII